MRTKQKHILYALLLLAAAGFTASCSQEELPGKDNTEAGRLTVSVTDSGYTHAPRQGRTAAKTRTKENGFSTEFTEGDKIGLFAVKEGKIDPKVDNLPLTAAAKSEGIVWEGLPSDQDFSTESTTYYAYYPYQEHLKRAPEPDPYSSKEAKDFFKKTIGSWGNSNTQNTQAAYTAADLMIAEGSINSSTKTLSFSMEHTMTLFVFDLPRIENPSTSTEESSGKWEYKKAYSEAAAQLQKIALTMPNGSFRLLLDVKVAKYTDFLVTVSLLLNFTIPDYTDDTNNDYSGKYILYNGKEEEAPPTTEETQAIAASVGDLYMKDGTLLPMAGREATLTEEQRSNVLGIVFAGPNDEIMGHHSKPEYKNGLVLGIHGPNEQPMNETPSIGNYASEHPAPSFTSDWYVPSPSETAYLLSGTYVDNVFNKYTDQPTDIGGTELLDKLNKQLIQAGLNPITIDTKLTNFPLGLIEDGKNSAYIQANGYLYIWAVENATPNMSMFTIHTHPILAF